MAKDKSWSQAAPMGPWYEELDSADFQHAGLWCHIERHEGLWLCGYVGVEQGHAAFGADYNGGITDGVVVHGGLSYAGSKAPGCTREGLWWFGFDCGHGGDFMPKLPHLPGEYRTFAWVEAELRRLAEQVAAIGT